MNRTGRERCRDCSAPAVVRMQGVSVCARCGLERSSSGKNRRSLRAAVVGLFSSGFLAKMLLGAVAMAAVGGVAVSMPSEESASTTTTQAVLQPTDPVTATEAVVSVVEGTQAADTVVERAYAYAEAVQTWGQCVAAAAREHSGEAFDPKEACGETPTAADHGLDDQQPDKAAATLDKAEDKATKTVDKAEDKATKTLDKAEDKATKTVDKDE